MGVEKPATSGEMRFRVVQYVRWMDGSSRAERTGRRKERVCWALAAWTGLDWTCGGRGRGRSHELSLKLVMI